MDEPFRVDRASFNELRCEVFDRVRKRREDFAREFITDALTEMFERGLRAPVVVKQQALVDNNSKPT